MIVEQQYPLLRINLSTIKYQHFGLKHDVVKRLLKDEITSIDYMKSEMTKSSN